MSLSKPFGMISAKRLILVKAFWYNQQRGDGYAIL